MDTSLEIMIHQSRVDNQKITMYFEKNKKNTNIYVITQIYIKKILK
jgi:hypothetical protein